MYNDLEYVVDDGIATITLNRPDNLNAFTPTMRTEMLAVCDEIDADDAVRAVVVTGAGRAFCAGAELGTHGGDTFKAESRDWEAGGDDKVHRDGGGTVSLRLFQLTKPIFAAINGAAVGVGITMTLPMDQRWAKPGSKIGFVFARRGIVPEACSSWFLPRLVGMPTALEWGYTGRVFLAEEAAERGLVTLADDPYATAVAKAREIADHSAPLSVMAVRQLMWRGLTFDHPMQSHRADSRGIVFLGASDDCREGVESFLEKREPSWTGKPSTDMPDLFPHWQEPDY